MIDQQKALRYMAELRAAEDMRLLRLADSILLSKDVWISGTAIFERAQAIARARGAPFRDLHRASKLTHPLPPVGYLN